MGVLTKLLKPALKRLAKRGNKTLAKNIYKYRHPALNVGITGSMLDTPESNDQEQFNNFYDKLVNEGLIMDEDGLNDGVINGDDLLKYWNENSYHNKNKGSAWMQTALSEGSAFIPYAGIPISLGLGYAFDKNAESEDEKLYQDIRRRAYAHMGKEMPEQFNQEEQ